MIEIKTTSGFSFTYDEYDFIKLENLKKIPAIDLKPGNSLFLNYPKFEDINTKELTDKEIYYAFLILDKGRVKGKSFSLYLKNYEDDILNITYKKEELIIFQSTKSSFLNKILKGNYTFFHFQKKENFIKLFQVLMKDAYIEDNEIILNIKKANIRDFIQSQLLKLKIKTEKKGGTLRISNKHSLMRISNYYKIPIHQRKLKKLLSKVEEKYLLVAENQTWFKEDITQLRRTRP